MSESVNPFELARKRGAARMNPLLEDSYKAKARIARLQQFAKDTPKYLDTLEEEFEEATSLNKKEIALMFICVGLQWLRQNYLTRFPERMDDQTSAKNTWGHTEEHSGRHHRYYNPSLEEIITNPVPFDANYGANGTLSGGGFMGHRVTAIGHDPLLGYIFGTANIATSTLTNNKLVSYHITTQNGRDAFGNHANTFLVLSKTVDKLFEGTDGLAKVGMSLLKEVIHLQSDLNTKHSLPFPVVSLINGEIAAELASYGLDFANVVAVSRQVFWARAINCLIGMLHYLFYIFSDKQISKDLFKVKTKKIICYSNVIASGINIGQVYLTQDYDLLDIGGIANTIYELITSGKFIKKVKRDYIFGNYDAALAAL